MTLEKYFGEWLRVIDKNELLSIVSKINTLNKPFCPEYPDIFKAFELCKYNDLKIVLIGQDPYPQKGVATGILFGNKKEISEDNLSSSLKIVKEAAINFELPHNSIIFDQSLEDWAKQGILMINSALTCEMNKVGSHTMLWRPFISSLLINLSKVNSGIIYVLFGEQANTFSPYINKSTNIILKERHPAYYARIGKRMPYDVFENINKMTKEKYGIPIEWYKEY